MNVRTVAVGWFSLVVLYTVLTKADQASGFIGWASGALDRLASPEKGLIPDRSAASSTGPAAAPALPDGGLAPAVNQGHPGTSIPSPYAPGATPPAFPSWLTPATGQKKATPVTGRT